MQGRHGRSWSSLSSDMKCSSFGAGTLARTAWTCPRPTLGRWQLGKDAQHLHNQVIRGSASARLASAWVKGALSELPCQPSMHCLPSVSARLEFEKVRQLALQIAEENQSVCASCLLPRWYVFRRLLLQDGLFLASSS